MPKAFLIRESRPGFTALSKPRRKSGEKEFKIMDIKNLKIDLGVEAAAPATQAPSQSAEDRFPKRHPQEDFPDPPSAGSSKLALTMANVEHLLAVSGVEVAYDVIKKRMHINRGDHTLEECDLISLANLNGLGGGWFLDFIGTIARRNPLNPVATWIDSKPWDGTDRLQDIYRTVQVQEGYPTELRDVLLYRWLLSCVAAALKAAGFKTRGVLTFQGDQGVGKTTWIARLVPDPWRGEWIKLDHHLDAGNKDSILGGVDHWITEIGELDSSLKKDVARTKGFLTNDCDKIRPPYAKTAIEMPRRTVFAATVNDPQFLVDTTGNSRWWTIAVDRLDFNHDIDMQQVFAQLAIDFRKGEQWWLTEDEEKQLADLNAHHQVVSAIEERIRTRIAPATAKHTYMTASKVLEELGFRQPSNPQAKECGRVLRSIYGRPKRVRGADQWKVALLGEEAAWAKIEEEDDEIY